MILDRYTAIRARERLGLTQFSVAIHADVSHRTIQRLEAGKPVSLDTARRVADALEIELTDLRVVNHYDDGVDKLARLIESVSGVPNATVHFDGKVFVKKTSQCGCHVFFSVEELSEEQSSSLVDSLLGPETSQEVSEGDRSLEVVQDVSRIPR